MIKTKFSGGRKMQDQASPCPMKKLPGMLKKWEGQHYSRFVLNASNMVLLLVRICLDQISDKIFNLQVVWPLELPLM